MTDFLFELFVVGYQGMIQDRQQRVPLRIMQGMSITLKDKITGPFQVGLLIW